MVTSVADRPIGVFDSGVGGLTVVDAITKLLPQENLIYFGDTARAPYGPRPIEEVRQFAFEIMDLMMSFDVKMLVIACNAMTAAAYTEAVDRYSVPVIGVIDPALRAGIRATRNRKIGVLGTKATIESGEYQKALVKTRQRIEMFTQVCPIFVERVEAGDTFSQELIQAANEYLVPLLAAEVDTLILGCTHYPLLTGVLHWVTKGEVLLISSADEVAKDVYAALVGKGLLRRVPSRGSKRFLASGDADHFREVGSLFVTGIDEVETVAMTGADSG